MRLLAVALLAGVLGLVVGREPSSDAARTARPHETGGAFLDARQVDRIRRAARRGPYAVLAARTVAAARAALAAPPNVGDPAGFEQSRGATWRDDLYLPGREEASRVRDCALAYMLTAQPRYAARAARGLVAWSKAWATVTAVPGHTVSGSVAAQFGIFYGFVRDTLDRGDRAVVNAYFRSQEQLARRLLQGVVDRPWATNVAGSAPYGNGATWPRLAEAAAAYALGDDDALRAAVHGPDGGLDLDRLIRGGIRTDSPAGTTGPGRWLEEDERASLGYAWFAFNNIAWTALLARDRGIDVDLAPLERVYEHYVPWFRTAPQLHPALRGWKEPNGVSWDCHAARPSWTDCSDAAAREYFSDHRLETTYEAARAGYGVAALLWPGNRSFRLVALAADGNSGGSVGNNRDPYVAGLGGLFAAAGAP